MKKYNLVVTMLVLIVLGLVGFIVYDKVMLDDENCDKVVCDNKCDDKTEVDDKENNEKVKIEVKDAVNYVDSYYKMFNVRLPKIVGNSSNIDKLNDQILNKVLPETYSDIQCHAENASCYSKGTITNYQYVIKNVLKIL